MICTTLRARALCAILFVSLASSGLVAAGPAAPSQRGILLVIADDVAIANIGVYGAGQNPPPTPTVAALARRGVLFRNVWSCPVCSATRATISTGRYGFRTGVGRVVLPVGKGTLPQDEETLPSLLSSAGQATALIGKWHLGNRHNGGRSGPNMAGWSYHAGTMWHGFIPPNDYFRWHKVVNGSMSVCRNYATTENVDDALAWIGEQTAPWYCCVSFNSCHAPFHAPPSHLHSYDLRGMKPRRQPLPFYKAMVQSLDTEFGRLLAGLGPRLQETTVIFMGDNGTPNEVVEPPWDNHRAKWTVYEGGVRVPLIIAGPDVSQPGREVTTVVNTVDLFSTVLELAGLPTASNTSDGRKVDSVSLVPYLRFSEQAPLRSTIYTEVFPSNRSSEGEMAAIRDQRYKIIYTRGLSGPREFYDLQEDPTERVDLLDGRSLAGEQQAAYQRLGRQLTSLRNSAD